MRMLRVHSRSRDQVYAGDSGGSVPIRQLLERVHPIRLRDAAVKSLSRG
jgi:hypothetical protein